MAATGGGKIRTRRYHIVSKPYAKAKQQQPGLISRVTDTVKSIVPSWLQKYFKNGEVAEGGETQVEVEQNNVAAPPNGNQEAVHLPDGRDSPGLPSTSNAEPSTSKASLNFQDALSRPPLNRSHLHFPSQDGSPGSHLGGPSSLFSPPSTSTAPFSGTPFAVASNFSLVKEIKDSSSQHEDDNISTTSGFSSRASDKDVPTSKSAPLLWSPETERTHSGSQLPHTSLKKPAFNLSVFGTSSSSSVNNSVLNSSQLGDSPFYPGKTTYGGAAAVKTARARPGTPYQAPVRRQIKAKPAGAQPCGVTSATARRILQSLERMSSPLADAKRIPSTISSPLSTSLNHSDQDGSAIQSKRKKVEPALPPVQKLVIPAAAAVSGNRSMSFRPSLTPGFVSKAVDKGTNEMSARRPPQIPDAVPSAPASTSNLSYPMSSTPAFSLTGAGGGKMKRDRTLRPSSKRPDQEVSEVLDLPAVSLPISKTSLPTFSFSSTPPTSALTPSTSPKTCVSVKPPIRKEPPVVSTPYTFASPIFKATSASPSFSPSTSLQSEFTFSEPTVKITSSVSNGKLTPELCEAAVSEKEEEFEGPFKPAKVLKQGSVLDVLRGPGFAASSQKSSSSETTKTTPSLTPAPLLPVTGFGDKFKPAAGSWDCDSCLVRNKPSDKTCVACHAPQPSTDTSSKVDSKPAKAPAASLATLFAPPAGSWDCDTCLVRNKPEVVKCVACDTAKPGTGVKPALTLTPISKASSALSAPPASSAPATTSITTGLLGFGDKFKKPEGAWDCEVCMVQNKKQDKNCVSCQSAKPGAAAPAPSSQAPASTPVNSAPLLGFGDKFKKPEGSWECGVCCVQNKAEDQQCVACQSAKPGAKAESKGFGAFGTQSSNSESSSSGFKFGTSSLSSSSGGLKFGGTFSDSSSTGFIKFGNASSDNTSSTSFKFGGSNSETSSGFTFGGNTVELGDTDKDSETFKFGGPSGSFKFGASNTSASTSEEKKSESQNSGTGFKFSEGSRITLGSGATSNATSTASVGFSFGVSKPEEKADSSLAFSFSAPKAKAEKQDSPPSTETVSAAPTPVTNSIPVFGKPPIAEPPTAVPSFGEPAAKEAAGGPATTFMFGKTEEKKDNSGPSTGFVFNASKDADKPASSLGFSFTQPDPPKEPPKPTFSFGKPAEPTETAKPVFSFGQNASDAAAPKPTFGFMGSSSSAPASSSPAPSLFGTPSSTSLNPTPAPTNAFVFGQNASSDATPSKTFMFGQQQDSQAAPGEPPAAPAPQAPFVFGSGSNSSSSSFSFGNAASTPASAAPAPSATPYSFGFTSNTSTAGFGSGQTPAFGSSQPSVPTFGAPAPTFTASTPAAPAFGTKPSPAPVFGQQPNTTPTFGSATASAGQGFQFGGSSGFGASNNSSSSSGVFTFGGGSGTTPGPTASPAMSTQPAAPGGSFNFTPNFNIGSAKNSFNATPTGQHNISGRKIKTAVRRRK